VEDGRRRRGRRVAGVPAALAAVCVLAVAGIASAEIIQAGNVDLRVNAKVQPKKLPKKKRAPVKLKASAAIATQDGSPAPGLKSAVVDFDVQGAVYTKGLGRCRQARIDGAGPALARRRCRDALVGRGSFRVELDGAENTAAGSVTGPLSVFNGRPVRRRPSLLVHASLPTTPAETFVVRGVIAKAPGSLYGRRVRLRVPEIAGGAGRLTAVKVRAKRRWRHRGKRRSYLLARCQAGNFVFRGDLRFSDGTHANGSLIRWCRRR